MSRPARMLGPALLLVLAGAGCSQGQDCDGLARLTAERDAARSQWQRAWQDEQAGRAGGADVTAAHDRMHALDRRTYDLEQACADG